MCIDNIKCKYCNSKRINKCGKQNNKQRYLCRDCKRTFIIEPDTRYKYDKYNLELRKLAITMYMNNVGIRKPTPNVVKLQACLRVWQLKCCVW